MDLLERTAQRAKALLIIGSVVSAVYTLAYFSQNNNLPTVPILTVIMALLILVVYDMHNRMNRLERSVYRSKEEY